MATLQRNKGESHSKWEGGTHEHSECRVAAQLHTNRSSSPYMHQASRGAERAQEKAPEIPSKKEDDKQKPSPMGSRQQITDDTDEAEAFGVFFSTQNKEIIATSCVR